MAKPVPEVDRELGVRLEQLGYELVDVEWAGSNGRPIIRIRIDWSEAGAGPEAGPETGDASGEKTIGVSDCARVTRALEPWLDGVKSMPERYVLEVSSPGVDRPLSRPRDFKRFAGRKVALKGSATLAGRSSRLEGELLGLASGEGGEERVRLRLSDGDEVEIPRSEITGGAPGLRMVGIKGQKGGQ